MEVFQPALAELGRELGLDLTEHGEPVEEPSPAALGQDHALGAAVLGVGQTLHEPHALELADVERPRGLVGHLVLAAVGCHGRLAQSRIWRIATKDRGALAESVARLFELPFESVVLAHGELVTTDARERLAGALRRAGHGAGALGSS